MMHDVIKHRLSLEKILRTESDTNSRLRKLRLDKNEINFGHHNYFINLLKKNISSDLISAYPESYNVYKLLSKKLKIIKEKILITPGSDLALKNCFQAFYKKNSRIITIDPTFAMVDIYCKVFQTNQIKIGYDKSLNLDYAGLLKAITKNTSLIIIANPNSPTGTVLNNKQIDKILKISEKKNVTVVIDEAYYEFSKFNCLSKIKRYKNLIIVRTFSKIFGLAGLRLGYVVSSKINIKKLKALKPMYEANSVALKAAEFLLKNKKILKKNLSIMRSSEKYAENFCKKNSFKFIKCYANFFHIYFNYNPLEIQNYLIKKNILVKGGPGVYPYNKYLRISFSNLKNISRVLHEIKKFVDFKNGRK